MPNLQIFPSLLSANMGALQQEIETIDDFSDGIHFDVMDGNFVPNLTFGAPVLKQIHTRTFFDVHLMMVHPEQYIEDFINAGAEMISVHFEVCPHLHRVFQQIWARGKKAGVAINPTTSFACSKSAIAMADFVLVMSVNPGFGGQQFIPEVLEKIQEIRKNFPEKNIEIDGGINATTAELAKKSGANWLVAGNFIFGSANRKQAIESLR